MKEDTRKYDYSNGQSYIYS